MTTTWGGSFDEAPDADMMAFTSSMGVDVRLLPHDGAATAAHARVLAAAGLLSAEEASSVAAVVDELVREWRDGRIAPEADDEDVHSFVERVLTERLGETGRRIHAGRSRNDLVATDLRSWCRDAADAVTAELVSLAETLVDLAEAHAESVMPGYTHVQRAQPVSLGFHLLAHAFASSRDLKRFAVARAAADVSALGAGALAGNTLDLDPRVGADALGFADVFDNAMDAVSDRDFVADLLYACALCGVHLSRLAEEIVLWTSAEFGFARIADSWSTGSSMMPQKRNPDVAELIRGRSSGGIADLSSLLILLKGLPLAYDRDLQEDKAIAFKSVDNLVACVVATRLVLGAMTWDEPAMARAAASPGLWATDLAERLVARGVPFREAHEAVGKLVRTLESRELHLNDASEELLKEHHPALEMDDRDAGDPRAGLRARSSRGGTSPDRVAEQIDELRTFIKETRHRR